MQNKAADGSGPTSANTAGIRIQLNLSQLYVSLQSAYLIKVHLLLHVLRVHLIEEQPQVQNEAADGSNPTSANTARFIIRLNLFFNNICHYHLFILSKKHLLQPVLHVHPVEEQPQVRIEAADGSSPTSICTAGI